MKSFLKISLAATLLTFLPLGLQADVALPGSFGSWTSARASRFSTGDLARVAGADAPVLREYGVLGLERREYTRGTQRLGATLYQFRDASGAYGMFTFWRAPEMALIQMASGGSGGAAPAKVEIGGAAADDARFLACFGNYLLDVQGTSLRGIIEIDLRGLVERLAASAGEAAPLPTLPAYLPRVGLLVNSDRYMLGTAALERIRPMNQGDWAGFAFSTEAELGRYQLGDQAATLLLLLYPTPQIAVERAKEFHRYFDLNQDKPKGTLPPAFLKRTGPMVALVLDTDSPNVASFLLDRVNFRWDVTWNERASKKDEPSIVQIVVGLFIGTGLLLVAAVLVSFAFGGFRLLVARLLPGKVFDRPSSTEIIRLHLDKF